MKKNADRGISPVAVSQGWRQLIETHPATDTFPMMNGSALNSLVKSIQRHGFCGSLVFCLKGSGIQLLDGRNRLAAAERAYGAVTGIDRTHGSVTFASGKRVFFTLDDGEPYTVVRRLNIDRRHLDRAQKRRILIELLVANPELSNRALAATAGSDHKTVASARVQAEATGEIPQLDKTKGADGKERRARASKKIVKKPRDKEIAERSGRLNKLAGTALAGAVKDELYVLGSARWQSLSEHQRSEIVALLNKLSAQIIQPATKVA